MKKSKEKYYLVRLNLGGLVSKEPIVCQYQSDDTYDNNIFWDKTGDFDIHKKKWDYLSPM